MKYIKKIFEYLAGRPMNRYEYDEVEIILNELLSMIVISAIVVCIVYMLMGIK